MEQTARKRRLTAEDKDAILGLAREGMSTVGISQKLDIHGSKVNGFLSIARKRGIFTGSQAVSTPPSRAPQPPLFPPPPIPAHPTLQENARLREQLNSSLKEILRKDAIIRGLLELVGDRYMDGGRARRGAKR